MAGFRDYSIGVNLIGRDISASKALDKLGKKAKTTADHLASASKKATFVIGAMSAAAIKFAKAAADDEKTASSLANTLKTVTGASSKQVAQVEKFIGKAEMFSTVADDNIRPAFDRLVRSTKNIGEAQKLTNLALEIAAKKGMPVEAVANALAKAHDGNVNALKRIGIAVPKAAASQKIYGTQLKVVNGQLKSVQVQLGKTTKGTVAFDDIIKIVGKDFNGSIAAQSETAAYKMAQFQRAMDRTQETLGYMLLPYLKDFADILIKVEPFVARNKDNIKKIAIAMFTMSAAVLAINTGLKVFYALQSAKVFATLIARWAGFTTVVATGGATVTEAGVAMSAAGTAVQVAWAPFLLTIAAIAAAFVGIKLATDKLIANRKALLNDPSKIPSWSTQSNKTFNGTEMSSMPKHAKGGIVTRPHIGMIGESGPEAIIPLNKAGMFGGITIINNIQGAVVTEKELALKVRNDIAQLLRRKGLSTAILGV